MFEGPKLPLKACGICLQDMTRLPYLHEPGVLWNLKCRYSLDDIYTYTGTILIAVNPFAGLPHLYGPHMMDQYRGVDLGELSPHVYAIADAAYRQMRKEWKGQSILVRGGRLRLVCEVTYHAFGNTPTWQSETLRFVKPCLCVELCNIAMAALKCTKRRVR
jgi:hypothetical protein